MLRIVRLKDITDKLIERLFQSMHVCYLALIFSLSFGSKICLVAECGRRCKKHCTPLVTPEHFSRLSLEKVFFSFISFIFYTWNCFGLNSSSSRLLCMSHLSDVSWFCPANNLDWWFHGTCALWSTSTHNSQKNNLWITLDMIEKNIFFHKIRTFQECDFFICSPCC